MEWKIDLTEVNGLRQWYRKQPKLMQKASALLLNRFAWGTRDEAVKQIGRTMIVRNPRFVSSMLKVTQTTMGTPISQQRTLAGSIYVTGQTKRGDFSGWTEQEKGTTTARKRVSTLASRSGDIHKQMRPKARLKQSNPVTTINEVTPRGGTSNYGGFIAMLARQKFKGLVRVKGSLYLLGGRAEVAGPGRGGRGKVYQRQNLELVQEFKKKQPHRIPWLRQARAIYFQRNPPQRTWEQVVGRLMKPPGKR